MLGERLVVIVATPYQASHVESMSDMYVGINTIIRNQQEFFLGALQIDLALESSE